MQEILQSIWHCGGSRRTNTFYLLPKDSSKHSQEILRICVRCPVCKLKVVELIKVDKKGRRSPPDRLPYTQHEAAEARVKTDEQKPEYQPYSDYTLLIAKDPAIVFMQVLERQMAESLEQKRRREEEEELERKRKQRSDEFYGYVSSLSSIYSSDDSPSHSSHDSSSSSYDSGSSSYDSGSCDSSSSDSGSCGGSD